MTYKGVLTYKGVYRSDQDNILEDFYLPTLSHAKQYDRAVGFFSSSTISCAAQALSIFVRNEGKIRLVLGAFTEIEDIEAVKQGCDSREFSEKIGEEMLIRISQVNDELFQNRFETLAWLVAHGYLEVKIALRAHGMFHDKVGIISDEVNDKVVFAGSANETTHALLPTHNFESINVFKTWIPEQAEFYGPHIDSFSRLWLNEIPSTLVLDIPTAVNEKLLSIASLMNYTPDPEIELEIAKRVQRRAIDQKASAPEKPYLPNLIDGNPFEIRSHQKKALNAWKDDGGFKGTFDLATGSGKTITAIYAIVKLSKNIKNFACVIAVPYQNLADQWVDTLKKFNMYPLRCYVSRNRWENKLSSIVHELSLGSRNFAIIVVVNRTLKSPEFQKHLKRIRGDKLFWIGDECHHHTTKAYEGFLPDNARFRIGLSATPMHYIDEERNERLNDFYGNVVFRYSLREAVNDKVLTPYLYYPHIVELISVEADEFILLSEKIGRLLTRQHGEMKEMPAQLTALLMKRARLIGMAKNKLRTLKQILENQKPTQHTLFYCGDGAVETDTYHDEFDANITERKRQIESVSTLLHRFSWKVSHFTAEESRKDRNNILENFRLGIIDAMVAIRCLDEGIDVPACSTAYILASSRDPRQFVQRRGRILRRSPGKEHAIIHDFIVILPEGFDAKSNYAKRLIQSELARVAEFSSLSENCSEAYIALAPVLKAYDLEHKIS
ncbi:MAG: DEAD/DEAH box helicase family protein [Gammaproteobacteria bacterium]|nr:DEAD/DEAH box helicase family protein [Gammaproteobacteria bacterium]